ncbi:MAG: MotA/TolQ/ExbB proton channel family protein [Verrucomicrobiales bacterium]
MIELISKGGPLIWLLLGCSFVALGIFVERFFHLHRSVIDVGELLQGLSNLVKKQNYAEALHEAAGTPGPVARVIKAGLVRHEVSRADLKQIVQEAGQLEVPKLERYLPVLLSICYVAPLVGLLGTVLGLTDTFIKLETGNGFATPAELSGGVYKSLLTSAAGLAVAIPAYLLYAYLAAFVKSLMHDMERAGIEIVNIVADNRPAIPAVAEADGQIIAFNREAGHAGR